MNIKEADIRRLTLKSWAAIDDLRRNISSAAQEGEWTLISGFIIQIIEMCTGKTVSRDSSWIDVAKVYGRVFEINKPSKDFPILTSKEKGKPLPWEYPGRSWYFWLHLFSKAYGWSESQVEGLDIDTAIALYQEITIDQQLDNEWEYGLSEIAYPYNQSTKKNHFKPLTRPDWMRGVVEKQKPIKLVKMPVAMLPAGNVINLDEIQPTEKPSS